MKSASSLRRLPFLFAILIAPVTHTALADVYWDYLVEVRSIESLDGCALIPDKLRSECNDIVNQKIEACKPLDPLSMSQIKAYCKGRASTEMQSRKQILENCALTRQKEVEVFKKHLEKYNKSETDMTSELGGYEKKLEEINKELGNDKLEKARKKLSGAKNFIKEKEDRKEQFNNAVKAIQELSEEAEKLASEKLKKADLNERVKEIESKLEKIESDLETGMQTDCKETCQDTIEMFKETIQAEQDELKEEISEAKKTLEEHEATAEKLENLKKEANGLKSKLNTKTSLPKYDSIVSIISTGNDKHKGLQGHKGMINILEEAARQCR